jgi:hypothetical protein
LAAVLPVMGHWIPQGILEESVRQVVVHPMIHEYTKRLTTTNLKQGANAFHHIAIESPEVVLLLL